MNRRKNSPLNNIKHFIRLAIDFFYYLLTNPIRIKNLFTWLTYINQNTVDIKMPWITIDSILYMNKIIKPEHTVFEFGSGGSTLFFSSRVRNLVSIEHNYEWYNLVKNQIEHYNVENVEYLFIPGEKHSSRIFTDSTIIPDYTDNKNTYQFYTFGNYAKSIEKYPDFYFDIIFIDGRSRPSCIFHSIKKLKKSGFLIIDNTERKAYKSALELLKDYKLRKLWGPVICSQFFSETSFYKVNTSSLKYNI